MIRVLALSALTIVGAAAPLAQRVPRADALLDRWGDRQRAAFDATASYRFTETVERELDGPFGARRMRFVQEVHADERGVVRRVRRASIDGEPVDVEQIEHVQRRMERAFGPDLEAAGRVADLPPHLFARFRPVRRLLEEDLGRVPAWRLELRPHRRAGFEEATLWFTRTPDAPALLRSRVVITGETPGTYFIITTDYGETRGPAGALAFPRRQRVEGVMQQQRRWRTFTALLHTERRFDDIQVIRGRR